jgi:hypothetical protein
VQAYEVLEQLTGDVTVRRHGEKVPVVRSMVQRHPSLLQSNPATLMDKWTQLQADPSSGGCGFTRDQVARMVKYNPSLLKRSMTSVTARIAWLDALGVRNSRGTLVRQPSLVGCSTSSLDAKVGLLRGYGVDATRLVMAMPATLSLSLDALDAKLRVLMHLLGAHPDQVAAYGTLLGVDVRQRLRTRVALLAQLASGRVPEPRIALSRMAYTEARFLTMLAKTKGVPKNLTTLQGYRTHIGSAAFQAFADDMERRLVEQAEQARQPHHIAAAAAAAAAAQRGQLEAGSETR